MATKAQLLAEIASDAIVMGTEQLDFEDVDKNLKAYHVNIFENKPDGTAHQRNIGFYVYDEGGAGEAAYRRDTPNKQSQLRSIAKTYLDSLIPGTFVKGKLTRVDEEEVFAIAKVYQDTGTTIEEKEIFIYNDGGATHKLFTRLQ